MEEFLRSLLRNALRILRQIHAPNVVVADVKHQIKPLSEEVKGLQSSVDQLLSIVKSTDEE